MSALSETVLDGHALMFRVIDAEVWIVVLGEDADTELGAARSDGEGRSEGGKDTRRRAPRRSPVIGSVTLDPEEATDSTFDVAETFRDR